MKIKAIIILLIFFISFTSCKSRETKTSSTIKKDTITNVNSLNYVEKIKAFLKWYKSNYEKILKIQLVDLKGDGATAQYRVNFTNTDKYLALLKSSCFFSSKYIETMEKYFELGDKKLVELKQNDGPPIGFEYDLLLYTQEPESLLENIENIKYEIIQKTKSFTIVKIDNDLSIKLDKKGLIESISK